MRQRDIDFVKLLKVLNQFLNDEVFNEGSKFSFIFVTPIAVFVSTFVHFPEEQLMKCMNSKH